MSSHDAHCPKLPWMLEYFCTETGKIQNLQYKAAYAPNHLEWMRNLNYESQPGKRRLTSVMCTMGPKCRDVPTLEKMIAAGMSVARFKMPFFGRAEARGCIANLREACENHSKSIGCCYQIPIAMDLKGPEIRTGTLKHESSAPLELIEGNQVNLTNDPDYEEHVTENTIYVDYSKITEVVERGDKVILGNNVHLSALEVVGSIIRCLIENTGYISNKASVSLHTAINDNASVHMVEIDFAKEEGFDIIIISNVRNTDVILEVKHLLGPDGVGIKLISKIENSEGVKNIQEIVKESDGILISRSDLSMEIPVEKLFIVQKMLIAVCNQAGKPVICAPEVFESMIHSPHPKRSEVLDVANAVLDGADCILLSRETAVGDFPIQSLETLTRLCKEAEASVYEREAFRDLTEQPPILFEPIYALAIAVVECSLKCSSAAIILLTTSGRTARVIAKYRPRCPIIAITRKSRIARQLRIVRALEPIHFVAHPSADWEKDVNKRLQFGITYGKYMGFIRGGDTIIVVKGIRAGTGFTNTMSVYYASDFDALEGSSCDA